MSWVETAPGSESSDHILSSHSLNPEALAHVQLYRTVILGPSNLSRSERETAAAAVSAMNRCHY